MKKFLLLFLSVVILFSSCDSGIQNNQEPVDNENYATETQKDELITSSLALIESDDLMVALPDLPVEIMAPITQELVLKDVNFETVSATLVSDFENNEITSGKTYDLPMKDSYNGTDSYQLVINRFSLSNSIMSAYSGITDPDFDVSDIPNLTMWGDEGLSTYGADVSFSVTQNGEDLLDFDVEFEFDINIITEEDDDDGSLHKLVDSLQLHKFKLNIECANCIKNNMILKVNIDETNVINEEKVNGITTYLKKSDKTLEEKVEYVKDSLWPDDNSMSFVLCAYTVKEGIFTTYSYDFGEMMPLGLEIID